MRYTFLLLLAACGSVVEDPCDSQSCADTDAELDVPENSSDVESVETDADADADADTDADADADADADDADADADTDADADADADDADSDAEVDTDAGFCGNGFIDPGEACDGDLPMACTASCGTVGSRSCVACRWGICALPAETCHNHIDDDCDGLTDEDGSLCACDIANDFEGTSVAPFPLPGTVIATDAYEGDQAFSTGYGDHVFSVSKSTIVGVTVSFYVKIPHAPVYTPLAYIARFGFLDNLIALWNNTCVGGRIETTDYSCIRHYEYGFWYRVVGRRTCADGIVNTTRLFDDTLVGQTTEDWTNCSRTDLRQFDFVNDSGRSGDPLVLIDNYCAIL